MCSCVCVCLSVRHACIYSFSLCIYLWLTSYCPCKRILFCMKLIKLIKLIKKFIAADVEIGALNRKALTDLLICRHGQKEQCNIISSIKAGEVKKKR